MKLLRFSIIYNIYIIITVIKRLEESLKRISSSSRSKETINCRNTIKALKDTTIISALSLKDIVLMT
jgi:hypothetical protein